MQKFIFIFRFFQQCITFFTVWHWHSSTKNTNSLCLTHIYRLWSYVCNYVSSIPAKIVIKDKHGVTGNNRSTGVLRHKYELMSFFCNASIGLVILSRFCNLEICWHLILYTHFCKAHNVLVFHCNYVSIVSQGRSHVFKIGGVRHEGMKDGEVSPSQQQRKDLGSDHINLFNILMLKLVLSGSSTLWFKKTRQLWRTITTIQFSRF